MNEQIGELKRRVGYWPPETREDATAMLEIIEQLMEALAALPRVMP